MGMTIRDPALEEIADRDDRYPYEAYEFVTETVKTLDRQLQEPEEGAPPPNITAKELCVGCCDLAWRSFGMMAPAVFATWGIRTTRDIGDITFRLIEGNVIAGSDEDRIEDFDDLFPIQALLAKPVHFHKKEATR